jgi:hypothetical protein
MAKLHKKIELLTQIIEENGLQVQSQDNNDDLRYMQE